MKYSVQKSPASELIQWQSQFGRHTLPWQNTGSAYKTWLSEVMLQQTQVATVIDYYHRFLSVFPTVFDLATAPEEQVMTLWQGLGYYSRARNLHACAQQVVERFGGQFPKTVAELESLPGIGRSTAGAIMSLGHQLPAPILDGNVKRVFCRLQGVAGYPEQSAVKKQLWHLAEHWLPVEKAGVYNQALMDLGAQICVPRVPKCELCPLQSRCVALKEGITHLLPTPKPKKPKVDWFCLAVLAKNARGRILMARQTEKELWRGLWMPAFLKLDGPDLEGASQWLEQLGLTGSLDGLNGQAWVVHELTHRRLHFKTLVLALPEDYSPVPPYQLVYPEEKPLPRVFMKLRDQVGV
ncbi:MAG: A/G-specific adenine glycosylase [Limnobacter sp.]|nr:A/G-specific adenine glycosylase [Limnobacter sp.]